MTKLLVENSKKTTAKQEMDEEIAITKIVAPSQTDPEHRTIDRSEACA